MLLSFEDLLRLHNIFSILFLQRSYVLCILKPDLFVITCGKRKQVTTRSTTSSSPKCLLFAGVDFEENKPHLTVGSFVE